MAVNVRGPNTRRKHLSKNKKKSWRKVNVDDVEEYLEDKRLQERTGGLVSEKKDEQLFYVDTQKKKIHKEKKTSFQKKRKGQDILKKVDADLAPPPPKKEKRHPEALKKLESKQDTIRQKLQKKQDQKEARIERLKKRREVALSRVASYDLWGDKLETKHAGKDPHYLKTMRKTRVKVPSHHEKPVSKLKAVEPPHPGSSYNPDYVQYQNLLLKAHLKEVKRIEAEKKLHRALAAKFPKADEAPTEASLLQEMSAGLFEDGDKDEEDEEADLDLDNISVNPPVRRENKKNEKQRRKEKQRKQKEKELLEAKTDKQKEIEFFRIKTIKSDLKKRDKMMDERSAKRQQIRASALYRTNRLGSLKYEDPDEDLKLSDELVGSLRELKPEGSLLADRFKSLQKRNIIEPRIRARFRRKYKQKFQYKKGNTSIKEAPLTKDRK